MRHTPLKHGDVSLEQVARNLGISIGLAHKLEKSAFEKLRRRLNGWQVRGERRTNNVGSMER